MPAVAVMDRRTAGVWTVLAPPVAGKAKSAAGWVYTRRASDGESCINTGLKADGAQGTERSGVRVVHCREVSFVLFANVAEASLGKTDTRDGELLSLCKSWVFVCAYMHQAGCISVALPPVLGAVTEYARRLGAGAACGRRDEGRYRERWKRRVRWTGMSRLWDWKGQAVVCAGWVFRGGVGGRGRGTALGDVDVHG